MKWLRIVNRADCDEDLRLTINAPGTLFCFVAPVLPIGCARCPVSRRDDTANWREFAGLN